MTRELIMKDYFTKRMRNEKANIDEMLNNLSKEQLLNIAKIDCIAVKSNWDKKRLLERISGSIANVIYAIECCTIRNINESKEDFYKRIYVKYWM